MDNEYKNRLYRILQHKNNMIKEKKKVAQTLREQMMQKASSVEKNMDSGSCYDTDIFTNGPVAMKKVCHDIFKDYGSNLVIKELIDCLNPNTFCISCCSNFIGAGHMDKRNSCVEQCSGQITAKAKATGLTMEVLADNAQTPSDLAYDIKDDDSKKPTEAAV